MERMERYRPQHQTLPCLNIKTTVGSQDAASNDGEPDKVNSPRNEVTCFIRCPLVASETIGEGLSKNTVWRLQPRPLWALMSSLESHVEKPQVKEVGREYARMCKPKESCGATERALMCS